MFNVPQIRSGFAMRALGASVPTAGDRRRASLDPSAADAIADLLTRAAARGAALLTVLHAPALIPRLADRVVGLSNGRVVFDLPRAALDSEHLRSLYGQSNGSRSADLTRV